MNWRRVLGLSALAVTAEDVEHRYRILAKQRHPDVGGSHEAMCELGEAKAAALAELEKAPSLASVPTPVRATYADPFANAAVANAAAQARQANNAFGGLGGVAGTVPGAQQSNHAFRQYMQTGK
jgi:DnaJ-class molecular chaperone